MKLLCYDETKHERIFVGAVASKVDLHKLFLEFRQEIIEGGVIVEIWRQATPEEQQKKIAQRRLSFFNN